MAISKKRLIAFNELLADPAWVAQVLANAEHAAANPYAHSRLGYWLKLDTWTKREGLLVLAGIDPASVIREPNPAQNQTFFVPDLWDFDTAQPFDQEPHFTLEPFGDVSHNWHGVSAERFDDLVERTEEVNSILDRHREALRVLSHVLDRSIVGLGDSQGHDSAGMPRYTPGRFIAWASSIRYQIRWLEWANSNGFVGDQTGPFVAPFFDADAPDYPELLAIAVRSWEHARKVEGGTPKQRILEFLEKRYPDLGKGSREAIAQVANWQPGGGRPARPA